MVAAAPGPARAPGGHGVVLEDLHPRVAQGLDEAVREVHRADRVEDEPHGDAVAGALDEGVGEEAPGPVAAQDVGLEVDGLAGGGDGGQHGGIGLPPVFQEGQAVAARGLFREGEIPRPPGGAGQQKPSPVPEFHGSYHTMTARPLHGRTTPRSQSQVRAFGGTARSRAGRREGPALKRAPRLADGDARSPGAHGHAPDHRRRRRGGGLHPHRPLAPAARRGPDPLPRDVPGGPGARDLPHRVRAALGRRDLGAGRRLSRHRRGVRPPARRPAGRALQRRPARHRRHL